MTSLSTQSNPGRQHTADPIIDLAAPLYAGLQCRLTPDYGWRRYTAQSHGETPLNVWFSGHIEGVDPAWLLNHFRHDTLDFDELTNWLRGVSGHFALVVLTSQWALAAVDRVRSIPIAAAQVNGVWTLDGQPARLAAHAGFSLDAIEPFAALSLAMAGYTVGRGTLYRPLVVLGPGEVMCFQGGQSQPLRERYYSYRPWRVASVSTETAATQLEECTLAVMEQTLATLDGRPLVVPLSAGRDSRLIVSAARHLGYDNVRCFTYGRSDGFEAAASKAIAERLGYPWRFVPVSISRQREFFTSQAFQDYLAFSDSCVSVPFVQDMAPLQTLRDAGYLPEDSVMANGNTGDFISGLHVVPTLREPPAPGLSEEARWVRLAEALFAKHFVLWDSLQTSTNKMAVLQALRDSLEDDCCSWFQHPPDADHGVYEQIEFRDRQCKYVITGQRIYEFLGFEWRLPLWHNAYLDFWERMPLSAKAGQGLYATMLMEQNWGGVWQDIPVNQRTVRPQWIRPLRSLGKVLHAPFGKASWHRFERRYFQYWMNLAGNSAVVPYWRAARDNRGARNGMAWLAEAYLHRHGLAWDGTLLRE